MLESSSSCTPVILTQELYLYEKCMHTDAITTMHARVVYTRVMTQLGALLEANKDVEPVHT